MSSDTDKISRRRLLKVGFTGAIAAGASIILGSNSRQAQSSHAQHNNVNKTSLTESTVKIGSMPHEAVEYSGGLGGVSASELAEYVNKPFDPTSFLSSFDFGKVTQLPDGRVQREYTIVSLDKDIEVAPGISFPAWTYNGHVPGPTIRATEGDLVKINYANGSYHDHNIHFHGFHRANMDGVFEVVKPGGSYTYEFTAEPYGLHLYHCHVMPLRKHIAKGLYGTFIVDPKTPRPPAKELVMVMNGFDIDFDEGNEFYTVNGIANYYRDYPIELKVNELVRVYLVNLTEFDLINSMHTHATFFKLYRTGTDLQHYEYTDTVTLGQGERSILEFSYQYPGKYMFHAHQSEFAELGWMGMFNVTK